MAELLKGKEVAAAIAERSAAKVEELKARGITPTLAILRVGARDDDLSTSAARRSVARRWAWP